MNQLESPFRIPTTFPFLSWDIWVFLLGLQNVLLIPLFFFFLATPPSMWDLLAHWPGIKPSPLHWKHRVLTTGLPGKSLILFLDFCFTCSLLVNCTSSSVAYFHILFLTTFLVRSSLISLSKISDSPTFYLLTSFFLLLLPITTYIVSYTSLCFLSLKQVISNKWTIIYCFIYLFFLLFIALSTYLLRSYLSICNI